MRKLILFLLVVLFLLSCASSERKLNKVWFFISNEPVESREDRRSLTTDLGAISFLNFEPDGEYTAYFSAFEYGKWMVNEKDEIVLENYKKQQRVLPIERLTKNELSFVVNDQRYEFEGFDNKFTTVNENPFSKENNRWRMKAEHKESDAEISNRLKNHFHFWEKYFAWALDTEKEILNVRSLPSPLKIYSNGFGVIPYEEQSPKWTGNFYDSADSRIAFEKVNTLMKRENIDWPTTTNRFKLFASAFRQLQQKMR